MLDKLWDFIDNFVDILKRLAEWVLDGIIEIISSIFYFMMDAFLLVIEAVFASIHIAESITQSFGQWINLPPQLIWLLNRLNLPVMLSMIAAAITIRLLLNLIPSVATRV